ncbi:MAG TPA: nucleotide exchange factor GrpE [Actinomycetota bacterium]|nr:nucleotide exchange factor GrpE [Actinomycetota bacterium]
MDRPRVRVTDKRRVRDEGGSAPAEAGAAPPADPAEEEGLAPTPEAPTSGSTTEASGTVDLEAARQEAAAYRDHLVRLQAEFENYRKRVLKEQTRAVEMAAEPLIRRLLEVIDEFELALMAAEQKPDFDKFLHGVELVYAKLMDTLKAEGLERIEAEGKPFDPELHEALMGSAGGEGDLVVGDVLRQGYTLRDRVIRPSGVRVTHEA